MVNDFGRTRSVRTANAALASDGAADLAAIVPRVTWVGGQVSLLERALLFTAGRANRLANAALAGGGPLLDFALALSDITDVRLRSRLGIKTIEVRWNQAGTVLGLRCWGTAAFAQQLRAATTNARR